jgi:hypothetical protein
LPLFNARGADQKPAAGLKVIVHQLSKWWQPGGKNVVKAMVCRKKYRSSLQSHHRLDVHGLSRIRHNERQAGSFRVLSCVGYDVNDFFRVRHFILLSYFYFCPSDLKPSQLFGTHKPSMGLSF